MTRTIMGHNIHQGTYTIECRVFGRVQMVMFRDFVQRNARMLRVQGYVHNNKDGTVTVVASGAPAPLAHLVEKLHNGSLLSRVDDVTVRMHAPIAEHDFVIAY